ncbi:MAG: hypothetical protein WC712_04545 [Candidatus Brocadiia bacterium]
MTRLAMLLVLASLLLAVLTASAEDKPLFPPLASLADSEDITDKVLAWDVPAGKIEEYSLFDEVPPLPEPDPSCKAPLEFDSFAGGRKIPMQIVTGKVAPSLGRDDFLGKRCRIKDFSSHFFFDCPWFWRLLPKGPKVNKNDAEDPVFGTIGVMLAFEAFCNKMGECQVACLAPGHFLVASCAKPKPIGIFKAKEVLDVRISDKGEITSNPLDAFKDCEVLLSFYWGATSPHRGAMVFLEDGERLVTLREDGTTKRVPFTFKSAYGVNCWNAEPRLRGRKTGCTSAQFPILEVIDRNFGYPRDSVPPEPEQIGERTSNAKKEQWAEEAYIRPSELKSRVVLIDLLTGATILDSEGIFDLWVLDGDTYMCPRVASKGKYSFAVLDRSGVRNLLPYEALVPARTYQSWSYTDRISCWSDYCVVTVDFIRKKLIRFIFSHRHDTAAFQSLATAGLNVSVPFESDGKQVRQVWKYREGKDSPEYSFLIEDVFRPESGPCAVVTLTEDVLLVYTGEKYCRINLKRKQ